MSQATTNERLVEKTPEASFLHVLQAEFNLSLREAREVVSAAQECYGGGSAPNYEGIAMVSHDA